MNRRIMPFAAALVAAALLSGCAACRTGQRPSAPPTACVSCVGRLTDLESAFPWFENGVDSDGRAYHDYGHSPRAVFRIVSPANQAGRIVGVLFKCRGAGCPQPPAVSAKGGHFSLELPADFFAGPCETIDNDQVRILSLEPASKEGHYGR